MSDTALAPPALILPAGRRLPLSLILILVLVLAAIGATAYGHYQSQRHAAGQAAREQIKAIGDLKAAEITRWLGERRGDAEILFASPIGDALEAALADPVAFEARQKALSWIWSLIGNHGYSSVVLLNATGEAVVSVPQIDTPLTDKTWSYINRALYTRQVAFSDIYGDYSDGGIHLDFVVPLRVERDGAELAVGALLLRIDPRKFLFPLLQTWPTSSATGETMLVRREGDEVVYLNPPRHYQGGPLSLRHPLSGLHLLSVRALRGEQGEIDGLDYRGVEVLAAVRDIDNSPWHLVAKVDRREVEAPIWDNALKTAAIMSLLMLVALLLAWIVWRRQDEAAWRKMNEVLETQVRERTAQLLESQSRLEQQVRACQVAEAALGDSEERMRFALEAARMGVWEWDLKTQAFRFSPELEQWHGFAAGAFGGTYRHYLDSIHPEDREAVDEALNRAVREETDYDAQYRVVWPDGSCHWLEAKGRTRHDAQGRPLLMIGLCRDITERRRAEELVQEQQEQLAHMGRLSVAGEMAAILAHELRQPLAVIVNWAQMCQCLVQADTRRGSEISEALRQIVAQGQKAGEIIGRLRDFTRKTAAQRTAVDVNALIREVAVLANVDARRRGILLRFELAGGLPVVQADPVQIQQVLMNLIRNGIDALAEVEAQRRELVVRTTAAADGAIEVAVADRGPGLDDQMAERLFQPFYTTKASGTGLGLSISKSIVEAHGGTIWATPNSGHGVTFHFTVPGSAEEEDREAVPLAVQPLAQAAGGRGS
ncbi:MAG: ATP-binding protein [Pseudomonadota bacterium]|nr:ATP-binding protein [Pseudomonadota bacterium]